MQLAPFLHTTFTIAAVAAVAAAQNVVVISCDRDNTLYESATGDASNGAGESVFVGVTAQGEVRRALLRFDVAGALPSGARVVAASLQLDVVTSVAPRPAPAALHRLTADWGEGTSQATGGGGGMGASATVNDATWTRRFHPNIVWTTPGGDFAQAPSAVFALPIAGSVASGPAPGLAADVQTWLDQPANNHGWLLKAVDEGALASRARRIHSRESLGTRPTLRVHYLLPAGTGTWGDGCAVGAGTFTFGFVGAMVGGTTVQLAHTGGPAGSVAVNYFALGLDAVGAPLLPGCALHLPLQLDWIAGNVVLLDGSGAGSSTWPVPAAYPGLFFVSQSAALADTPLGLVTSNAGLAVIH